MTDLIALARRWVECKNFRWMVGMETDHYGIVVHADEDQWVEDDWVYGVSVYSGWDPETLRKDALPDLSDPATVGLLEHQVLGLYGGDQFVMRSHRAPKMGGEQGVTWLVQHWGGAASASGSVVLVGFDHVKIACLVDALERYEEVK